MPTKYTIKDMQKLAAKKRGTCLSAEYLADSKKLKWQCSKKHIWKATPNNIKRDKWCPKCAREKTKLGIEKMQEIAEKREGKCLSKKYINRNTHITWQCAKGHIWKATSSNVKRGTWCPKCSRKK